MSNSAMEPAYGNHLGGMDTLNIHLPKLKTVNIISPICSNISSRMANISRKPSFDFDCLDNNNNNNTNNHLHHQSK